MTNGCRVQELALTTPPISFFVISTRRGPTCSSTSRRWTRLGRRTSLLTTPIERALLLTLPSRTHSRRHQYGVLPPNMRLVILAVSTCGAINPEGHTFISSLAQRMDNSIPPALFHQASWATPKLGPMIRMALGFAVRRGLAAAIHRWWRHVPAPPPPMFVLLPPPLPPPPPPPPPRRPQLDDDLSDEVELHSEFDES